MSSYREPETPTADYRLIEEARPNHPEPATHASQRVQQAHPSYVARCVNRALSFNVHPVPSALYFPVHLVSLRRPDTHSAPKREDISCGKECSRTRKTDAGRLHAQAHHIPPRCTYAVQHRYGMQGDADDYLERSDSRSEPHCIPSDPPGGVAAVGRVPTARGGPRWRGRGSARRRIPGRHPPAGRSPGGSRSRRAA